MGQKDFNRGLDNYLVKVIGRVDDPLFFDTFSTSFLSLTGLPNVPQTIVFTSPNALSHYSNKHRF